MGRSENYVVNKKRKQKYRQVIRSASGRFVKKTIQLEIPNATDKAGEKQNELISFDQQTANNFPAVDIDKINSNQETGLSEFKSDWESDSIKASMATENNPCMPTGTIKEEPEITLDEIKKEPSVSLSDENSSFDDTEEAYSSTNDECSNCPIQDESTMRQDLQMCNTNSSISCNCSNRLIRLENNQEEIKMKLDQLLDLVRDITIRFRN